MAIPSWLENLGLAMFTAYPQVFLTQCAFPHSQITPIRCVELLLCFGLKVTTANKRSNACRWNVLLELTRKYSCITPHPSNQAGHTRFSFTSRMHFIESFRAQFHRIDFPGL